MGVVSASMSNVNKVILLACGVRTPAPAMQDDVKST